MIGVGARDLIDRQPLRGRAFATGHAQADHEGERLLHFLARALAAQVAVVLQIHAVEFHQLSVVLDNRAGDFFPQPLRQRPAQIRARFLDAFVP